MLILLCKRIIKGKLRSRELGKLEPLRKILSLEFAVHRGVFDTQRTFVANVVERERWRQNHHHPGQPIGTPSRGVDHQTEHETPKSLSCHHGIQRDIFRANVEDSVPKAFDEFHRIHALPQQVRRIKVEAEGLVVANRSQSGFGGVV